jgi:hypothetical protein
MSDDCSRDRGSVPSSLDAPIVVDGDISLLDAASSAVDLIGFYPGTCE